MPPASKKTIFHKIIASPEEFEALTGENEKRMAVIDVYLDWCGPCVCMEPSYGAIWYNLEDPETRIMFF